MRPTLQILDHIVGEDVITYKSFLDTNLKTNIDHLVNLENDGSV